jgi:molybdopterin-guanine dinucleotide biosynthesis protein A
MTKQRIHSPGVVGLLLAGGEGRRLGGCDKGMVLWQGRPMASRVFEALSSVVQPVLISANRSLDRYQALAPQQVYPDEPGLSGQGPLAGLLTGMRAARALGARAVLVSPCDTPDITPGVFAGLLEAWASNPERPAIAECEGRAHPLHGVYPVASDRLLEQQLASGNRRVMVFAETAGAVSVDCRGAVQALRNRNRPEDF